MAQRLRRLPASTQVFWVAWLICVLAAFIRERGVFVTSIYPAGDDGANALLVIRAEHLQQLVGNYSRVGFHHPGPALLYVLAAGEGTFYYLLHVVPAPFNGEVLAASAYGATTIALAAAVLCRVTRSRGAAVIAFAIFFLFGSGHGMFANVWFPDLYMGAFLLFTVSAAAVAVGRTSELPWYLLAGGILVHGHVSFVMIVGVTTVVVAVGWFGRHRGGGIRTELAAHRPALLGAGVVLVVLLVPIALELILHFPGYWPEYLHFAQRGSHAPRSTRQALDFLAHYWDLTGWPRALFAGAALFAVALTITERDPARRRLFLGVYGLVILETILTFGYIIRGVDRLTPRGVFQYVGFFYETVPVIMLAATAAQLWLRISTPRTGLALRTVHRAALIALAVVLVGSAAAEHQLGFLPRRGPQYPQIVRALQHDPLRAGRPIAIVQDQPNGWAPTIGVGVQLQRAGMAWCADPHTAGVTLIYTAAYTCHGGASRWTVHASTAGPPPHARVVWRGRVDGSPLILYTTG